MLSFIILGFVPSKAHAEMIGEGAKCDGKRNRKTASKIQYGKQNGKCDEYDSAHFHHFIYSHCFHPIEPGSYLA